MALLLFLQCSCCSEALCLRSPLTCLHRALKDSWPYSWGVRELRNCFNRSYLLQMAQALSKLPLLTQSMHALSCMHQKVSNCIKWKSILIFLLAFIWTGSSIIPPLSSVEFRLKIYGSCIQPCVTETLAESICGRTAV